MNKTLPTQKMKSDWREVLSVDYLNSINCWAKLEELQKVIPYQSEKYKQIILNASSPFSSTAAHELSFCNVIHCCCFISYGKSFTPYDILIFDSADGRINW